MIVSKAFDVEVLPNFFSIAIVDIKSYLSIFADCVNSKGKPIPLIEKYSVKEIIEKLNTVEKVCFKITDTDDSDLLKMVSYLSSMVPHVDALGTIKTHMFAYNSHRYDDYMVNALLMLFNRCNTTKELITKLYNISKKIINNQDNKDAFYTDAELVMLKDSKLPYTSIDLMEVFGLNKAGVNVDKDGKRIPFGKGLKQTSINLMWYELLEWSMPPISEKDAHFYVKDEKYRGYTIEQLNKLIEPFDRYILEEYVEPMCHYNFNDVFILCEMIRMKMDEIRLRYSISASYDINCLSDARSKIADKLVTKFYSEMSGLKPYQFKDKRTERSRLSFNKVIFPHIAFKTKELQTFLDELKKVYIFKLSKDEFERTVTFCGTTYTIATGGIHSVDRPRVLKSTDKYTYVHWDYASYYPSIMISYEVFPAHLNKHVFVKLIKFLRDTRVAAKHAKNGEEVVKGIPNKVVAEALKIVINSIYGKLGFEDGFLYDRLAQLKVTLNGQLMTMTLIEELELNGIHVVSANTDGIVLKLPNDKREIFKEITTRWNETNRMGADGEEYKLLVQRDINNYLDVQTNDDIEYKGDFDPKMYLKDLTKGYNAPIVAEAVSNYFIDNIPIMQTLTNERNILKFCMTQNVGKSWKLHYRYVTNGKVIDNEYQRNTRFYVANSGGCLEKRSIDGRVTNLCAGQAVVPLNSLTDDDISTRNINYKYYYQRCFDIVNPILLGIAPKGKGKTIVKKFGGMYQNLFDFEDE